LDAAWKLQGELELRSRPWNTILPEEFMRGESTEGQRGGGGGEGRRRAGLRPARVEPPEVEWRCWEERTRRMRDGFGSAAVESRERRGTSSWSWPEEDDDEESEKREDARESDASESELSRSSGADARSDAEAPDARPVFRWSRSLSDLAAAEFAALAAGVLAAAAAGDGEGEGFALGLCAAAALLSPSSSRHRLEQLGALGENT